MMKRGTCKMPRLSAWRTAGTAVAIVVATAFVSFAAEAPVPGVKVQIVQMMEKDPALFRDMMADPHHVLAMAYRNNLVMFGKVLQRLAHERETIPPDIARVTVDEMNRSLEQLDKQHSELLKAMPEEKKARLAPVAKMMNEHLAEMKTQLGHLDALVKKEPVDSKQVLAHLQSLFQACPQMGMGRVHGWKGMTGERGMYGCCHDVADVQARDADLAALVQKMNAAPDEKKIPIVADILTRLVTLRNSDNTGMRRMQGYGRHHMQMNRGCNCQPPCRMQGSGSSGPDDSGEWGDAEDSDDRGSE